MSKLSPSKVLFVCIHNSGRNQRTEAFFNQLAASRATHIRRTSPARGISPAGAIVMKEAGTNLSGRRPRSLNLDMVRSADRVMMVGGANALAVQPPSLRQLVNAHRE